MSDGVQSRYRLGEWVGATGLVLGLFLVVVCGCPPRVDLGSPVYASAWIATTVWVLGSAQLLWLRPIDWIENKAPLKMARISWMVGWMALLIHTAIAFQVVHRWSHEAAFQHTARTAGVGEGVYVNYLVLLIWGLDAVWLAAAPERYARRPRWVGWTVHGFLTFIVFNATVVYGQELTRWAGVVWFAILGVSLVRRRFGLPA